MPPGRTEYSMNWKSIKKAIKITTAAFLGVGAFNKICKIWISNGIRMPFQNPAYYRWRFGNVYYSKTGTGSPILLIHDLKTVSFGAEWKNIIPTLAKEHTVYVIDLPGCGRSDKPKMLYTQYMYDQLITLFIRDVIKEKCDVIATGYSFPLVIMANQIAPEWIGKIIGISPVSVYHTAIYPKLHNKLFHTVMHIPSVGPFIYNICHTKKMIRRHLVNRGFYEKSRVEEELVELYYRSAYYENTQSTLFFSSMINHYLNLDIRKPLTRTNKDIYLIFGMEAINKRKSVKSYKEYSNRIKAYQIERTAGLPHLERPRATSQRILSILDN